MPRRFDANNGDGLFAAAGWLFAELALIFMIIAIGSAEVTVPPQADTIPSPTKPPDPPPTTVAPPPPPERSLELVPKKFTILVPSDGVGVVDEFRNRLLTTVGADGRVGLVLLFGVARPGRPQLAGQEVSRRLKDLLTAEDIPQLRDAVEIRDYIGTDAGPGEVRVELFQLIG